MGTNSNAVLLRRTLLTAAASLAASAAALPRRAIAARQYELVARAGTAQLLAGRKPMTSVWAYEGVVPGPTLWASQGEAVRIVVHNQLDQDTTVHWHGIRLPIAMDGVPGISQPPIQPGESFTYDFTPPDAGTFWYHPHANTLEQLGRGLAGVLIVEGPKRPPFDRELLWTIMDWRLDAKGQIAPGFGNAMEAAMAGRVGDTVTIDGEVPAGEPVRAGERVRFRIVNAALARIMSFRFEGHRVVVVAIDGQPCNPHEPVDDRVLLGPAMRVDVVIDMQGEPGRRYAVTDDFYDGLAYTLTHLVYDSAPPSKSRFAGTPMQLASNPLPQPDLKSAELRELVLQGGMMGGGAMRGLGGIQATGHAVWAINGMSMTGDGQPGMAPLATLQAGRSYVLRMRNDTAWWHPMHLYGHSFRVLRRNGVAVPNNIWSDTVLLAPRDVVDVAFVADNPGDWMLHCHVTDHQVAGMMAILRIADDADKR